jgi:hypothetical protein
MLRHNIVAYNKAARQIYTEHHMHMRKFNKHSYRNGFLSKTNHNFILSQKLDPNFT